LVGKPEGKTPTGRFRRRWKNKIKINFIEAGFGAVDWVPVAQDRG
jgi:hypothetical protein